MERAKVLCAAGPGAEAIRLPLKPSWQTTVPGGSNVCLPNQVLKVFSLATVDVKLPPEGHGLAASDDTPEAANAPVYGSDNWVISSQKSATRRAILASDPHRNYMQPSIRYLVDLNAPTLHIEGMGESIAPGVSFAHNDWIAYAGTVFWIDQEDLYVYEVNPAKPDQYKYQGNWVTFQHVQEAIKVKGKRPVAADLRFTGSGPVIYIDKPTNRAFAVKTARLEPGTSPYLHPLP